MFIYKYIYNFCYSNKSANSILETEIGLIEIYFIEKLSVKKN